MKTQLALDRVMASKFPGWQHCNNLCVNGGGRIVVLWDPSKVSLTVQAFSSQSIQCRVECRVTSSVTFVSFVYGLFSNKHRKHLWKSLEAFGANLKKPWLVLGDFNCSLMLDDRIRGTDTRPYDIRDFSECCQSLTLADLHSIGCKYIWSNSSINKPVWSKLDRALGNEDWMQLGTNYLANFLLSGCISDHSPCLVYPSALTPAKKGAFQFFNMWAAHPNFQDIVKEIWDVNLFGVEQFKLCRKLKLLKQPLKKLNNLEFSHISRRAEAAKHELDEMQLQLQSDALNQQQLRIGALLGKKLNAST